ncbi:B-4DMT family transporter [Nocardia sp. BMG51109]|uniref:B-4DMT family transporter n=1 Tax=Nocardia sp. BMG51109 TaxID=1056816 RepID=UPI000465995F|nr:B-4DMT family transporter [Nocardia sp. BMG51109]
MTAWVLRATVLGALTVGLRILLGFGMVYWPTQGAWMRILCLIVLIGAVAAWGLLDGRGDRRANPDPERGGADLTMIWLKAAVVGGLGAGLAAWLVDFVPKFELGDNGLLFELTAGASFIILLLFVPAMVGVALGRFLVGRESKKAQPAPPPTAAASAL